MKSSGLKKEVLLYGISIGLNRGSMLLFMPIIISNLNIEEYGVYSYILAIVYILAPFLSLNLSAGIVREGADDIGRAVYLQRKIVPPIACVVIILGLISYFTDLYLYDIPYITLAILLAGTEGLHSIMLAYERAANHHIRYLVIILFKVLGFIGIMYIMVLFKVFNLSNLFLTQVIYNLVIYILFSIGQLNKPSTSFKIGAIISFSALLLPHTLSQWLMNASNKLIVKGLCGDFQLGVFSVAFSIASVAMILNSGISLVIPQHIIKNYDKWTSKKNVNKFYLFYSLMFLVIYVFLIIAMYLDVTFTHKYMNYNAELMYSFTLIFLGFYLLGFYYYYSNILFYHKESKTISKVTVLTSIVSVGITYFLTKYFNVLGASVSVLITYFLYYIFIYNSARGVDSKLNNRFYYEIKLIIITVLVILFICYLFVSTILSKTI